MFLSACRRLQQKQKLLNLFCQRSRYVFVNSNPLNATEFSHCKNDSEIGNKNYFFPLEKSVYGTIGKAE